MKKGKKKKGGGGGGGGEGMSFEVAVVQGDHWTLPVCMPKYKKGLYVMAETAF